MERIWLMNRREQIHNSSSGGRVKPGVALRVDLCGFVILLYFLPPHHVHHRFGTRSIVTGSKRKRTATNTPQTPARKNVVVFFIPGLTVWQ